MLYRLLYCPKLTKVSAAPAVRNLWVAIPLTNISLQKYLHSNSLQQQNYSYEMVTKSFYDCRLPKHEKQQ